MLLLMTNPDNSKKARRGSQLSADMDNSKKIAVFDRCGPHGTPTPAHPQCPMPGDRNQASCRVTAAKAMATNAAASARKMTVSMDWNAQ
jgi:hypothetical protein